jgi:hypothetical protein
MGSIIVEDLGLAAVTFANHALQPIDLASGRASG